MRTAKGWEMWSVRSNRGAVQLTNATGCGAPRGAESNTETLGDACERTPRFRAVL